MLFFVNESVLIFFFFTGADLSTCVQPSCQQRKILIREKQNLRKEIGTKPGDLLSLKTELLQKPSQEEKKQQKLEEKNEVILVIFLTFY